MASAFWSARDCAFLSCDTCSSLIVLISCHPSFDHERRDDISCKRQEQEGLSPRGFLNPQKEEERVKSVLLC